MSGCYILYIKLSFREALGQFGCADAISLVSSRDEVDDLLKLDNYIDLIIPRGSNELVRSIKERSKSIPGAVYLL